MGWKQNKMAGGKGGESSASKDSSPSTYSPLNRKAGASANGGHNYYSAKGHQFDSFSAPEATATYSYAPYSKSDTRTQYDALPVGTLGTYDPAADEIDYGFYQNARPNRRRLLYTSRPPEPEEDGDRAGGDQCSLLNGGGGGGRRSRRRRDSGLRCRGGGSGDTAGAGNGVESVEDSLDDVELSTETLYVMLLVLVSTAVTMLAAYLILL